MADNTLTDPGQADRNTIVFFSSRTNSRQGDLMVPMITEVESRHSRQVPHSEVWQKVYESAENDDWSLVTNNALPSHVLTAERDNKHLLFLAAAKAHVTAFEVIFAAVEEEDGAEKVISDLNDRGRTLAMCIYRGGSKPILERIRRSRYNSLLSSGDSPFFHTAWSMHLDMPEAHRLLHSDIFEASLRGDVRALEPLLKTFELSERHHYEKAIYGLQDPWISFSRMGSLYFAAKKGFVGVVKMLLAALRSDRAKCNLLLECNGRTMRDEISHSPLNVACEEGRLDIVKMMSAYGIIQRAYPIEESLCILCVKKNDVEMLKVILEAKITRTDKTGEMYHITMRDYIHRVDERGDSALILAARSVHESAPAIVNMLLDKLADVRVVDTNGMTALHLACLYGREDVVKILIERGACVDAVSHRVQRRGEEYIIYDVVGPTAVQLVRDRPEMLVAAGAKQTDNQSKIEVRKITNQGLQLTLPSVQGTRDSNNSPMWCSDLVIHRIIDHLHWSDILSLCQVSRQWRRVALSNKVWAAIFYQLCSSFHHSSAAKYEYSCRWKMREGFFYQLCHILFPDLLIASRAMSMLRPLDLQCSWSEWKQQMKIGKIIRNAQRSHCYLPIDSENTHGSSQTLFVCHRKKSKAFNFGEGMVMDAISHLTCTAVFMTSASRFSIVAVSSSVRNFEDKRPF
ncbi:ankyrin repeat-containing protein [Planoprotostelium fungivorum]|uniref:Ankyrin repeat-containing protein n=1 Tax=Planoprotostelium fungivorum TaxID=1890364 RepID=A0A2P6MYP6_9EUKA|nr:ankyrin repeat-containing protein [Planoprotostelium fungivorum]